MNVCSCQNAYQSWIIIIQRIYVFRVSISWAVREVKLEDRNGPSKAVQADSPSASQYASSKPVRNIQIIFNLDFFFIANLSDNIYFIWKSLNNSESLLNISVHSSDVHTSLKAKKSRGPRKQPTKPRRPMFSNYIQDAVDSQFRENQTLKDSVTLDELKDDLFADRLSRSKVICRCAYCVLTNKLVYFCSKFI